MNSFSGIFQGSERQRQLVSSWQHGAAVRLDHTFSFHGSFSLLQLEFHISRLL